MVLAIHGDNGLASSRFLRDVAVAARSIGFRAHFVRTSSVAEALEYYRILLPRDSQHRDSTPHLLVFDGLGP